MKILVGGSWQKEKASEFENEAIEAGKLLAERKHSLYTGGGQGTTETVARAFKNAGGKNFVVILPSKKELARVGESQGLKPDKLLRTRLDYPERNVLLVKKTDALLAVGGGLGTLTEIVHAIKDYKKKVAVIDKGEIAEWIKQFPELTEKVFVTKSVSEAILFLERKK